MSTAKDTLLLKVLWCHGLSPTEALLSFLNRFVLHAIDLVNRLRHQIEEVLPFAAIVQGLRLLVEHLHEPGILNLAHYFCQRHATCAQLFVLRRPSLQLN